MKLPTAILLLLTSLYVGAQEQKKVKVYRNLNKAVRHGEKVEALSLSGKGLTEIPLDVFELKNLKLLNLMNNKITVIPDEMRELKSLEKLVFIKNEISELPTSLAELTELKSLLIFYNKVTSKEASALKKLMPDCEIISTIIL